jgi:hypothetical protein
MLFELNRPVTLAGAFERLSSRTQPEQARADPGELLQTPQRAALIKQTDHPVLWLSG